MQLPVFSFNPKNPVFLEWEKQFFMSQGINPMLHYVSKIIDTYEQKNYKDDLKTPYGLIFEYHRGNHDSHGEVPDDLEAWLEAPIRFWHDLNEGINESVQIFFEEYLPELQQDATEIVAPLIKQQLQFGSVEEIMDNFELSDEHRNQCWALIDQIEEEMPTKETFELFISERFKNLQKTNAAELYARVDRLLGIC